MRSTEHKKETLREARAQALLQLTPALVEVLQTKSSPKGDALEIARAAGILAAKRTWELIPYCHSIPLDHVRIDYTFEASSVVITSQVTAIWKTGVEMEALIAAQVAATTLFDMLKIFEQPMEITNIKVMEKRGGKSDFQEGIPADFKAAVLVTSDGTFAGKREDRSGLLIRKRLEEYGIPIWDYVILPDEQDKIYLELLRCYEQKVSLVLTTGGTGLGARDVTVEATKKVIDREIPGIMEAARSYGQKRIPYAMLSRGVAGVKGNMLIVNLPGSSKGVEESLDAIFPAILHTFKMMAGGGHEGKSKVKSQNSKWEDRT